jgi:5'-nucleotidase
MSSHSRRLFFKQGAALFGATLLVHKTDAATALVKGMQHIEADKELLIYHSHNLKELAVTGSLMELKSLLDLEPGYGLLLDTGGLFPLSKGKELSGKMLDEINSLRLKASLLGSEFLSLAPEYLSEILSKLDFPLVNCNYEFKNSRLKTVAVPYVIYKTKMKTIGVTGVGKMNSSATVNVEDPIVAANRMATYLKKQKSCDVVICLTELEMSKKFAEESAEIDFILGANDTAKIKQAKVLSNSKKSEVILSSAGQEFVSKSVVLFNEDGQRIGFDHRHLMCSDPYARNAAVWAKIKLLQSEGTVSDTQGILG